MVLTRICFPSGGIGITTRPDNTLHFHGFDSDVVKSAARTMYRPNLTHITSAESPAECFERMKRNETDVVVDGRPLTDDETLAYYVDRGTYAYANAILSGFDYSEYVEKVNSLDDEASALMNDFAIFDIYSVITCALFLLTIGLISRIVLHLQLDHIHTSPETLSRPIRHRRVFRVSSTSRVTALVLSLAFFLLATPFLASFQTDKVVTMQPDVIDTYKKVMERKAKIIFNKDITDSELLKHSSKLSEGRDDASARIYNYLDQNKVSFEISTSPKALGKFEDLFNSLRTSSAVMFSHNGGARFFKDLFCSWSREGDLVQILVNADPSAPEIVVGTPLRRGFSLPQEAVRLWTFAFEGDVLHATEQRYPQYHGFTLPFKRASTTPEHRRRQLILCHSGQVMGGQKDPRASGMQFFATFFSLYFIAGLIMTFFQCISLCI